MNILLYLINIILLITSISLFANEKKFFEEPKLKFSDNLTWNWQILIDMFSLYSNNLSSDNESNFRFINDIKLDFSFHFSENSYFLLRARNSLYIPGIDNDETGESTKLSYFYDFDKLYYSYSTESYGIVIGRNKYTIGEGIIFSNNSDGVNLVYNYDGFKIHALASYTGLIKPQFDSFRKNFTEIEDGSERVFAIGNLGYNFLNQFVYLAFLQQLDIKDYNDNDDEGKYNSKYFVSGINASFWKGFFVNAEFVYQLGDRVISSFDMDIKAFAGSVKVIYNMQNKPKVGFLAEYNLASGGKDRDILIASNDLNIANFSSFSQYHTGFILSPEFSNLHIARFKINATPFYFTELFRNFYSAIEYNFYMKYEKDSSVDFLDDAQQNSDESFIGQSVDLLLVWRILGGVNIITQGGFMLKGPVFAQQDDILFKVFSGVQLWF